MRWYPARVIALCFFGLILLGGLGYLVIWELLEWPAGGKKRRLSLQSKVVLSTTGALLLLGTLALRLSEGEWTWLQAFFHSVSARTAGFATADLSAMSQAGLLIMCFLMFVGASPGSTGGGVKTTTLFVIPLALRTTATNSKRQAFKLRILDEAMRKVFTITLMGVLVLLRLVTLLLVLLEPARPGVSPI